MDIDDEDGDYESDSVTHKTLIGDDLTREVRWFKRSGNAYRWSESGNRFVPLGKCGSLNRALSRAKADMYNRHSHRD